MNGGPTLCFRDKNAFNLHFESKIGGAQCISTICGFIFFAAIFLLLTLRFHVQLAGI